MTGLQSEAASSVYIRAIRAHRLLLVAITLLTLAGSVLWIVARSPTYQATTEVLVSPIPQEDQTLLGLPVIRDTPGDPTRAFQTAATLLESSAAASTAADRMGAGWDRERVLAAVKVEPQGQSSILAITGTADSAARARRLANAFARAALDGRNEILQSRVAGALESQRSQQDDLPASAGEAANTIASTITRLETIANQGDPTLAINERADLPAGATDTPAPLILVLALLAGLALGAGAAVLRELTDRAVRDEAEALTLFPVPVLARVPQVNRRSGKSHDTGWHMPPAAREAFRTVLAQIEEREQPARALMVLSASTNDGKTTSAIDLAVSIAASGRTAILLDLDLRKPSVAQRLGLNDSQPLRELLDPQASLAELVRPAPNIPSLSVLTAVTEAADAALAELLHARLPDLIAQARALADYVVIDTAPLGEVSDALRIVHAIDETIVVVRPGSTDRLSFETMRDLLERVRHVPLGQLVIGVRTAAMNSGYYGYGAAERELFRRGSTPSVS